MIRPVERSDLPVRHTLRELQGLPHPLLRFRGGSVDDYATIFGASPRPS